MLMQIFKETKNKEYVMVIFEKGLLKTSIYHYSKQMISKREGHQEVKKLLAIDERSEKDELRRLIVKLAEANERAALIFNRLAI